MVFVTGPAFAGKQDYICEKLHLTEEEFRKKGIRDVESLVLGDEDVAALADRLCRYEIVIMTETGGGVVPVDENERQSRERAGSLSCLLAERADTVIRVICGLPQILKGELQT